MKQKVLNMLFALTAMVGSASAQTLSIASIEAEAGTQAELVVKGAGLGGVTALQFNLSLPEGITLDEAAITKGSAASSHELSVSTLDSGDRLFVLYSMNLDWFKDGELLCIPITIGQSATSGNARLSTVRFASNEAVSTAGTNASAAINVTTDDELLRYDVDGDGKITIADVTALVNKILGKNDEHLHYDVDGDGNITIADVTALVSKILGKK